MKLYAKTIIKNYILIEKQNINTKFGLKYTQNIKIKDSPQRLDPKNQAPW